MNLDFIQLEGQLFDTVNKPVSNLDIEVQFFNIKQSAWLSFTERLGVENGKIQGIIEIPDRISTKNQTIRVVREILKSGGVPAFRIVKANQQEDLIEVIASIGDIRIDKDSNMLTADFGKNWLLQKEWFITTSSFQVIAGNLPIFELDRKLEEGIEEREKLQQQANLDTKKIKALTENVKGLIQDKERLQQEYTSTIEQLDNKEQLLEELRQNLELLDKDLAEETKVKERLQMESAKMQKEVQKLLEKIKELENNGTDNFEEKFLAVQKELTQLLKEKENLYQEKEAFLSSIHKLQKEIGESKELMAVKEEELYSKQVLIASLETKNTKLVKELEEATDFSIADNPNKLSASKVYGSIVNDVIKADEELVNAKYKLANVSLNLKTTVEKGPGGTLLGLIDFETAKGINGAAISDISIDVVPNASATAIEGQKMPNVLGLTETATRKVLLDYGLKLDAVYHPTNNPNLVIGQSFKQSPSTNSAISEGQEVIVIFAKPLN